jgi:nucleoside-diphosphate-sugar epimerase
VSIFDNKTVLVTGAAGICGQASIRRLLQADNINIIGTIYKNRNVEVSHPNLKIVKADLMSLEKCKELVRGVDAIIHCAALSGGAKKQIDHKVEIVTKNVIMPLP